MTRSVPLALMLCAGAGCASHALEPPRPVPMFETPAAPADDPSERVTRAAARAAPMVPAAPVRRVTRNAAPSAARLEPATGPRSPRFLEPIEPLYPSGVVVPDVRVSPVDLDALAERIRRRSPIDRVDPLASVRPPDPWAPRTSDPIIRLDPFDRRRR